MIYNAPWVEHYFPEGWYAKVTTFFHKGDRAKQHKHAKDHMTFASGPFRLYIGDENSVDVGREYVDIGGPGEDRATVVKAGIWHLGEARADNVSVFCFFNGEEEIIEEA